MTAKTALVLRHVHFEDLGSFASPLAARGYAVRYSDAGDADFLAADPIEPDLLVVLGGPIGVYMDRAYPFLSREKAFIAERLLRGKPTLGICLGAQLIAAALGARVYPSGHTEIGFAPIALTPAGAASPLRHLADGPVLHWHGDTYDLPAGAAHLASTALVAQQAFAIGDSVLALQFHPEAETRTRFERWLVGHASELANARIDVAALRADGARYGAAMADAGTRMFGEWLQRLDRAD